MQKNYIYINGQIIDEDLAAIQAKDQGLLFGYGVFETIRIYNGMPLMLMKHLERLTAALCIMEINIPSLPILEAEVTRFIHHIKLCNGVLRITVTKGFKEATILFTHRETGYDAESYKKGFSLKTSAIKRNATSPLSYLKTLNYMDSLIAKRESLRAGYDEALFINTDNRVSECSSSNIFFIHDQKLYTPAITCGLLNGIVRALILSDIVKELNLTVTEGEYVLDTLYQADEIFITNSVIQIMPIIKVDNQIIGNGLPGSTTKKIMEQYSKHIAKLLPN
ncbi:aminotransferase class IV [Cellulosilyticum sp. I15G10I2]|uniref:aminotransferase class IV n=1 Tax=Cellulosilyticum sp. I15G10I2 TaxID=1892843 RepID=UPI00085BC385|nr:aminotransferase class IV [Cellulosilyticum sp. I15G10I2]